MTNSLEGHLLVASAELRDPNFFQAVVLLIRHSEEGALGLILNRRTTATIRQVWEQVSDIACTSTQPLHLGGPVQGPLMALHAGQPGDLPSSGDDSPDESSSDQPADDDQQPDDNPSGDDSPADHEILPGLYFCADPEQLQHLVAQEEGSARYFVGYAGWGSGQLESELDQGSWLTAPATPEHVFCDEETAWQQITRHIHGQQMIATLNIKHVPKDPGMN